MRAPTDTAIIADGASAPRTKLSVVVALWAKQKRKITEATLERLGVGSGMVFFPGLERKTDAIVFKYRDGWKARAVPEKDFVAGKGLKLSFWNEEVVLAAGSETVFITEGELDCCALVEAGIPSECVLSVPNGAKQRETDTPVEARGYGYVDEALTNGLARVKRFVWCGDGDGPGLSLRADMARLLGAARFSFVEWPDGCKDANDVLISDGDQFLRELVTDGALPWPVKGLYRLNELPEPPPMTRWNPGFSEWESKVLLAPRTLSVVTGHPGSGKALALDTPIPTPAGWTTMGALNVGDAVYDERGKECHVTLATPIMKGHPCYRMIFDDGSEIIADEDHLWETHKANGRAKRPASVVTTRQISESLIDNKKRNHAIVLTGPIDCKKADLLIPPYTLGAWLGDGSTMGAIIHSREPEITNEITKDGFKVFYNLRALAYRIEGLQDLLRFEGVLGNKHIPPNYLRASFDQRLSLLQGLMDTDGHIGSEQAGLQCEYTSVKKLLAEGFLELALSLGIKARLRTARAKLYGKDCGPVYRILFRTSLPVFRLPRKLARQLKAAPLRIKHWYVDKCEPTTSVPVRCIQVDSPSRLYLAGRSFIPTHNTLLFTQIWFQVLQAYRLSMFIASFETRAKPHIRRQIRTLFMGALEKDMSDDDKHKADAWINDHYFFAVHPEHRQTLEWFLDLAEVAVVRHGVRIVAIDPWNRLEGARDSREREDEYIARCLRTLYSFAQDMDCHVQITAHPSKMESMRRGKPPDLEDIAGAKHWENMVDQGFVVHRPEVFDGVNRKTKAVLFHKKARFEELGYPCKLSLQYDLSKGRYRSTDYDIGAK